VDRARALVRRPRSLFVVLAVAAGLHGLVYVPFVSQNVRTDSWTYLAAANAIRDGSYSTPLRAGFYFVFPDGWFDLTGARIPRRVWEEPERQVFRAPGYPAYVALFGNREVFGDLRHRPVLVGQGVLFGLGAWFLMLSLRRWWGDGVALLGGLVYAVDPWSKHYVALVLSEALAGTVALAGLYAYTRASETRRLPWWAATGGLAGALALVRSVFVFAIPLVLLAAALARGPARARLARLAAAGAAAAALVVPWLAWTDHVVGRPTMQVWGEAYNLILAASGEGHGRSSADVEADPRFRARMDEVRALAPSADELQRDPAAHPRYLERADTSLREDALDLYRERLRDEPLQVGWETLYRGWFLWNAHKDWYQPSGAALAGLRAIDWVLLALALAGAVVAIARGGAGRGAALLLAAYTAILASHHVEARFAMPLRGIFLAFATLALVEVARYARLRRADE
jgi:hypothetical protein